MAAAQVGEMIRQFTAQYVAILDAVKADIMRALPYMTKWNAQRIITQILVRRHVQQSVINDFMKNLVQVIAVSAEAPVDSVLVQDALLSPAWTVDGALFSSRVNDLSRLDELFTTIRRGLTLGESMRDISVDIFKTGIQKGDVTALVDKLAESARLAARNAGDVDLYRSFMRDVNAIQRQVDRLVDPDTSTLRRAYQDVVDAAEDMNTRALTRAVDYAVYFRQKYEATRIADTEFMRAYGNTRIAEANYDTDVTCLRVRLDSSHRKYDVCDFYANVNLYGRGPGVYPKDLFPRYPFHPHCVLPGERVWWDGKLLRAYKSFYRGIIIEVTTASGQKVTVTANHPVLTRNGWVAAEKLTKTDDVVSCKFGNRPLFAMCPDDNNRPPQIKDVFGTLKKFFQVSTAAVPAAPEYLHGDGRFVDGNINIINTNGLLLSDFEAFLNKQLRNNIFGRALVPLRIFVSKSPVYLFFKRYGSSSHGIMRRLRNFLSPLFCVNGFNSEDISLSTVSNMCLSLNENPSDNVPANIEAQRDFILRFATQISFDNIKKIKRRKYSAHVYNLQVEPSGIYIASGILIKNCHCGIENIFEIEAAAADKSDFDPAAGKRYLKSLDDGERNALLGVNGKITNDWQDNVRGYEPQMKQKILIPEGAFYGQST